MYIHIWISCLGCISHYFVIATIRRLSLLGPRDAILMNSAAVLLLGEVRHLLEQPVRKLFRSWVVRAKVQ